MLVLSAVLDAVIVVLTWISVLSTLVVPRGSRDRLSNMIDHGIAALYRAITVHVQQYWRRDRILAWQAPLVILVQLVTWLTLFT